MAQVVIDDKSLKGIADSLRIGFGDENLKFKPEEMPQAVDDMGFTISVNAQEMGYANGQKAEYNKFWDSYQQNGNRESYVHAFCYAGWSDKNFYPKHNIQPTNAGYMFYRFDYDEFGNKPLDLVTRLEECGVELDFSRATGISYCFQNARVSHIGVIDATACTALNTVFANCYYLRTIDKLVVKESNTFDNYVFQNCDSLINITVEGVIGNNISFQWSPLTPKSLVSIVEHLSDTASNKTVTFKQTAINNADWSTTNYASWDELKATKPNWGFAYK